jgi:hypothetical protein
MEAVHGGAQPFVFRTVIWKGKKNTNVMVKKKLKLPMSKTSGDGVITPFILNLCTGWK